MRSRLLTLTVALTLGLAALIAAGCGGDDEDTTSADTEATTTESAPEATTTEPTAEAPSPDSASCVDAWNNGSNSAGQEGLLAVFADGGKGNVIVGSEEGSCVLAAYNVNNPTYVVYRQSGNAFAEEGGGPGDQFEQYRATIDPLDVILQASGVVEPVS